jgi:hypothetical protein
MVRRQGKRKARAMLELGNGEKKEEGEGSSAGLDAHDTYAPTHMREEEQRFKVPRPGSPSLYLSFKFNRVELNK